MRGRKPKPTHLKLVTGNPGRRPLNENEPKPQSAIPEVPAHLTDEAKAEWSRISLELHGLGLLTRIDRAALAAYCQAWADWIDAEDKIRRYGKVVKTASKTITRRKRDGSETTETSGGTPVQSPYVQIRNKALEFMHKFLVEFGMTPSSRSRVNASGRPPEDDPANEFLR